MKEIEYILKNLNVKKFLSKISKEKNPIGLCDNEILACTKGLNLKNYYNIVEADNIALENLLQAYTFTGIFFQKIKDFKLIYIGRIYDESELLLNLDGDNSIICFYSKSNKKYHLIELYWNYDDFNRYRYVCNFESKPSIKDLKNHIVNFHSFSSLKPIVKLKKVKGNIKKDSYLKKYFKDGLNLKHIDLKIKATKVSP